MNLKLATCVLSCSLLLSTTSYAAPEDPVAVVNGKVITEQDYQNYSVMREEQVRDDKAPSKLDVVEELIKRELVIQDAEKQGLDKSANFIARYNAIRGNLLANVATQEYLRKHQLTEAQLKQRYEAEMAKLTLPDEFKARHILVETEEAAQALIAQLDEGKDFSELAKSDSIDSGSAKTGGDLGWIRAGQVVAEFAAALEAMEKETYSKQPVKTQFGWHIIMLDDKRPLQAPPFESLKDRIAALVKDEQVVDYLTGLREAATVEIKVEEPPKVEAEHASDETTEVMTEKAVPSEAVPTDTK